MNKITYWNFSTEHLRESAIDMRSKSAINYQKKVISNDKSFKEWVHDFRHDCLKFVKNIIGHEISGVVVEIGAGTGISSCVLSKNKKVKKIYAIEYSKICVEELLTFVIKRFNLKKTEEDKIFPIVGDFNDIKLADNSVDFVIAMGALHHSEDREKTLREVYRVLKIGGYLIGCGRASFNTISNKQLNKLLDMEFNNKYIEKMGYDVSGKCTRRKNSEHDPLLAEWEYILAKCGFKNSIYWFLRFNYPFSKGIKRGILGIIWNTFGKIFFKIYWKKLIKKNMTQLLHMKIPYYPWFSKAKKIDDILIISKKEPYIKMP